MLQWNTIQKEFGYHLGKNDLWKHVNNNETPKQ